jgi:endonuclease YncB( thermonuclease family)
VPTWNLKSLIEHKSHPRTVEVGLDIGHAQLLAVLAWWFRGYAVEQAPDQSGGYESAEREARARHIGLWRDSDPVPPWEWRQREGGL